MPADHPRPMTSADVEEVLDEHRRRLADQHRVIAQPVTIPIAEAGLDRLDNPTMPATLSTTGTTR